MRESATEGLSLSEEAGLGGTTGRLFLRLLGTRLGEKATTTGNEAGRREPRAKPRSKRYGGYGELAPRTGNRFNVGIGRPGAGQSILRRSPGHLPRAGQCVYLPFMREQLGAFVLAPGRPERAAALAEEAAALSREAGDRTLLPLPLNTLGWVALLGGDLGQAEALHKESLALSKELGASRPPSNSWKGWPATLEPKEKPRGLRGSSVPQRRCAKLWVFPLGLPCAHWKNPTWSEPAPNWRRVHGQRAWGEGHAMSMERQSSTPSRKRNLHHYLLVPRTATLGPSPTSGRARASGDGGPGASS